MTTEESRFVPINETPSNNDVIKPNDSISTVQTVLSDRQALVSDNPLKQAVVSHEAKNHILATPNQSDLNDQRPLDVNQKRLELLFLKYARELRQELKNNVDEGLDLFLNNGVRAMILPSASSLCCLTEKLHTATILELLNKDLPRFNLFNHIPLDNKSVVSSSMKILNIFIRLNSPGEYEEQVRNLVWMQYVMCNSPFTYDYIGIDDYLINLKRIVNVFHNDGKFKTFCVTDLIVRKYSHKTAHVMSAWIDCGVSIWVQYCLGKSKRPEERGIPNSPPLILGELKLRSFSLALKIKIKLYKQELRKLRGTFLKERC